MLLLLITHALNKEAEVRGLVRSLSGSQKSAAIKLRLNSSLFDSEIVVYHGQKNRLKGDGEEKREEGKKGVVTQAID